MVRRAIVQIGTEKTGTTTLQHFLAVNRDRLQQRGFQYPKFCGAINHTGLAAYAMAPDRHDDIRSAFGAASADAVGALRARLDVAAAAEIDSQLTTLFCSEHCHSRLTTPEEVATLRNFLARHFDEVRISVYLRRQDQVALSLSSTRLKSGATDCQILPQVTVENPYFNYDRFLGLWEEAFGQASITVRRFDRSRLVGGDIVQDFVTSCGLGNVAAYRSVARENSSILPVAQDFLRRVNGRLPEVAGMPPDEVRGFLAATLAGLLPGRGARPARGEAEAFYRQYRASNEAVRMRYFPDATTLFDEDFTDYPESADPIAFDADAIAAVAALLHGASMREKRRLEAEIAIRDARLYWQQQQGEAALEALRRALRWHPAHTDIHRTLAEYLLRLDRLPEALGAATTAVERRPDSDEYWHFLGIVRRRCGDLDGAADAQQEVLRRRPGHAAAERELDVIAAQIQQRATDASRQRPNAQPPLSA